MTESGFKPIEVAAHGRQAPGRGVRGENRAGKVGRAKCIYMDLRVPGGPFGFVFGGSLPPKKSMKINENHLQLMVIFGGDFFNLGGYF